VNKATDISDWVPALAAGDQDAAQRLWENYFAQMVRLAAGKLQGVARRSADEEDVALSAFDSFCQGLQADRFPQIADRHDHWRLLVVLTARKAADLVQHSRRHKRGGGRVRGDSALAAVSEVAGWEQVVGREPTPEFSCQVREQMIELLLALGDPTLEAIALAKLEGLPAAGRRAADDRTQAGPHSPPLAAGAAAMNASRLDLYTTLPLAARP
jgi:hypothetical protein